MKIKYQNPSSFSSNTISNKTQINSLNIVDQFQHQNQKYNLKSARIRKLETILEKNKSLKTFLIKRSVFNIIQNQSPPIEHNNPKASLPLINRKDQFSIPKVFIKRKTKKYSINLSSISDLDDPEKYPSDLYLNTSKLPTKTLAIPENNNNQIKKLQQNLLLKRKLINFQFHQKDKIIAQKSHFSATKNQNQERRRKNRNAKSLKLTKIQHIPQIVFSQNQKCVKYHFLKPSMAEIDNKILLGEINSLQRNSIISMKEREKKQKNIKTKIRNLQQKFISYHSNEH